MQEIEKIKNLIKTALESMTEAAEIAAGNLDIDPELEQSIHDADSQIYETYSLIMEYVPDDID